MLTSRIEKRSIQGDRVEWARVRHGRRSGGQAEAIRQWQPWNKSTGPRTKKGKARSSRNADKGVAEFDARILEVRLQVRLAHLALAEAGARRFAPATTLDFD